MPGETTVVEYNSESGVLGYSVSSGLIIDIISNYVSIEGSAGYTYLQIDDLKTEDGIFFLKGNPEALILQQDYGNFIETGGFMAVVQLNVGFPL